MICFGFDDFYNHELNEWTVFFLVFCSVTLSIARLLINLARQVHYTADGMQQHDRGNPEDDDVGANPAAGQHPSHARQRHGDVTASLTPEPPPCVSRHNNDVVQIHSSRHCQQVAPPSTGPGEDDASNRHADAPPSNAHTSTAGDRSEQTPCAANVGDERTAGDVTGPRNGSGSAAQHSQLLGSFESLSLGSEVSCERDAMPPPSTTTAPSLGSPSVYPTAAVAFLLVSTVFQSFGGSGIQAVLELYFSTFLFPNTGASLAKRRTDSLSTTCVNLWVGLQQVVALSAGYLADKRWGNYKTQVVSNVITAIGSGMLIAATWHLGTLGGPGASSEISDGGGGDVGSAGVQHSLAGSNTTNHTSDALWREVDMAASFVGLALIAIGYGQAQTIQSVFVGNQFSADQKEAKKKSFSWYYLFCNVGNLGGELGAPVLRQTVHFLICICTVAGSFIISAVVFIVGHRSYRRSDVIGVAETTAAGDTGVQEGSNSPDPESVITDVSPLFESNKSDHDRSAGGVVSAGSSHTWRQTFSEIKPLLGVFVPLVVYWSLFFQQNSTWVLQGQEMNCQVGSLNVPPDAMPSFNDFLVIAIIPLLDFIIYPHLKAKLGIVATPIKRIGTGIVCTIFSFILAGILQLYISQSDEKRGDSDSTDCHGNVSIAWQLPQYVLISFAEVLVAVTGLEFAYSQAPARLRNVVTSLWFLSQAFGTLLVAVLAELPIPIRWQYFVYTILMCVLLLVYVAINRRFKYRPGTQAE